MNRSHTNRWAAILAFVFATALGLAPVSTADGLGDLADEGNNAGRAATLNHPIRLPVPSAEAARRSAAKVNEIFGTDAKGATTPEAKSKLAASLLGHAAETTNPTDCFVLLDAARSIASEAGDVETSLKAIAALTERFAVDGPALRATALEAAATKATPASAAKVVGAILETVAGLQADRDLEGAEKMAQLAATAARRAKNRDLQKAVAEELAAIREQQKAAAKAQALVDRFNADPSDGDAATELGRLRCFTEDDWEAGLPLLARGSDADLAALAKGDLAGAATLAARVQLADRWWEYAAAHKGPDAAAAEARARMHYGLALGDLQGLDKARVLKRLETQAAGGRSIAKRPKDLVLWLDASIPGSLRGPDGRVFDKSQSNEMRVAEWADLGGARAVARQKNPASLPTARVGIFGKLPSVGFDGKSYFVVDMRPPSVGTVIVLLRLNSTNNTASAIGQLKDRAGLRLGTRADGGASFIVFKNHATADILESPNATLEASRASLLVCTWPNPFVLRINGKAFPAKAPARLDAGEAAAVVVGAMDDGGAYPLSGDIAELRIYNRILNAGEIAAVESEMNGKWNSSR